MKYIKLFEQFLNESKDDNPGLGTYNISEENGTCEISGKDSYHNFSKHDFENWAKSKEKITGVIDDLIIDAIMNQFDDIKDPNDVYIYNRQFNVDTIYFKWELEEPIDENNKSTSLKLNEYTYNVFPVEDINNEVNYRFFQKLMPKTAKTRSEAVERISTYAGGRMFLHVQYYIVKPKNDDGITYLLHQNQYWLTGSEVNVTLLTISDYIDPDNKTNLGEIYVDTKVFLDECKEVFKIEKRSS